MIQYAHPLIKSVLDSIIDTMEKYTLSARREN
jgi:hypothetical protein